VTEHAHVMPRKVYYAVFAALMVFTAVTVAVAYLDLGPLSTIVAMAIASTKATLVMLYFMHLRYSSRLTWIMVATAVAWLAILIITVMSDYMSRGWLGPVGG
jgi:cytochrome c oxidase subunit 4